MFEKNTVFVVGAGASAEFGLPVGWKLLETIRDNSIFHFDHGAFPSRGNRKLYETVYGRYEKDADQVAQAFHTFIDISRGVETAGSIDEYINRYSDDSLIAELGKVLIAHAILEAEGKSAMARKPAQSEIDFSRTADTWIASFARAMFDGVRASSVDEIGKGITIICFNYDRCIEFYLEHAIMRAYRDVDKNAARNIVNRMNIIHPYGWLGSLAEVPFGRPVDSADLYAISDNLITWSETVREGDQLSLTKKAMAGATNLVFLGFAFANQNMKLLDPMLDATRSRYINAYATAVGLTNDIEMKLQSKIGALYGRPLDSYQHSRIHLKYGMECREFMNKQMLNFTA